MRRCAIETAAMSQQINLFNPAFRKTRDWLAAAPVAIVACVLLASVAIATVWTGTKADRLQRTADQQATNLKSAQERLTTLAKLAAEGKPDPQLATDLANARALLKGREEVMKTLEAGTVGNISGFAEYLRGFARQSPNGLWLTGFTIGAGGTEMEIRGRMLNPSALPEYIRRLNSEKVFQGRSFSALTINRPEEGQDRRNAAVAAPAAGAKSPPSPASATTSQPGYVEFVLMPSTPNPGTNAGVPVTEGLTPPETKR